MEKIYNLGSYPVSISPLLDGIEKAIWMGDEIIVSRSLYHKMKDGENVEKLLQELGVIDLSQFQRESLLDCIRQRNREKDDVEAMRELNRERGRLRVKNLLGIDPLME